MKRNYDDPNAAAAFLKEVMKMKTGNQASGKDEKDMREDWDLSSSAVVMSEPDQQFKGVVK